eukprot:GCRY01006771.1.p1 GENE.GCRY01006771.1~~GCRY01006771.1.p1  ORF type:complete len:890 (-),score=126.45 GCRY01006771.1:38-2707(-)
MSSKLREIWEKIDCRNYKGAKKICNTLLQKQKKEEIVHSVKALKALILFREGESDEAFKLCQEVSAEIPTNTQALYTLSHVYKILGHADLAGDVYYKAFMKNEKDSKLGEDAFLHLVRSDDFSKQKQLAMKLYAKKPTTVAEKERQSLYQCWIAASIYLQTLKEKKSPMMAERMLAKRLELNQMKTYDELVLYLNILEQGGKLEEAITVVESASNIIYSISAEKYELLADLTWKAENYAKCESVYETLLKEQPDINWVHMKGYIDCVLKQELSPEKVASVKKVIQDLQLKNPKERGVFLGEIEFQHRLSESSITPLLLEYFKRFSNKRACYLDIQPYIVQIPVMEREGFLRHLGELCRKADHFHEVDLLENSSICINELYTFTAFHKIRNALADFQDETLEETQKRVSKYISLFHVTQPLNPAMDDTTKERGHVDDLVLLAVCSLLRFAFQMEPDSPQRTNLLCQCISILEDCLPKSQFNFQFKLYLIHLYGLLGAGAPAIALYDSLELRSIQFDTLSYLVLDDMIALGFDMMACKCARSRTDLAKEASRSSGEYLASCFDHGTFSKLDDAKSFAEKVTNTHPLAVANVEWALAELRITFNESYESVQKKVFSSELLSLLLMVSKPEFSCHHTEDFEVLDYYLQEECLSALTTATDIAAHQIDNAVVINRRPVIHEGVSAATFMQPLPAQMVILRVRALILMVLGLLVYKQSCSEITVDDALEQLKTEMSKLNEKDQNGISFFIALADSFASFLKKDYVSSLDALKCARSTFQDIFRSTKLTYFSDFRTVFLTIHDYVILSCHFIRQMTFSAAARKKLSSDAAQFKSEYDLLKADLKAFAQKFSEDIDSLDTSNWIPKELGLSIASGITDSHATSLKYIQIALKKIKSV